MNWCRADEQHNKDRGKDERKYGGHVAEQTLSDAGNFFLNILLILYSTLDYSGYEMCDINKAILPYATMWILLCPDFYAIYHLKKNGCPRITIMRNINIQYHSNRYCSLKIS